MDLSDRVVVLECGHKIADGTPEVAFKVTWQYRGLISAWALTAFGGFGGGGKIRMNTRRNGSRTMADGSECR